MTIFKQKLGDHIEYVLGNNHIMWEKLLGNIFCNSWDVLPYTHTKTSAAILKIILKTKKVKSLPDFKQEETKTFTTTS